MSNNLEYAAVRILVEQDFNRFDFIKKSMEKYCDYNRTKHIQLVTQLVCQSFKDKTYFDHEEVNDFIHGLNHIFFNGVAAGQSFERFKEK